MESVNYVTFMTSQVGFTSNRSGNHDKMEEERSIGGKGEIHIVQLALHQTLDSTRPIWLLPRTQISLHPSYRKPQHIPEQVNETKDGQAKHGSDCRTHTAHTYENTRR